MNPTAKPEPSKSPAGSLRRPARLLKAIAAMATGNSVGGRAVRRIAPIAVGAPLLIEALRWMGAVTGDSQMRPVTWVGATLLLVLVTWFSLHLDRFDRTRAAADGRFSGLLETIPDAVIVVDASGLIRVVNAHVERLFGYRREEMLGRSVDLLVPERFRSAHEGHRAGFFARPSFRSMGQGSELTARRKDGSEFPTQISLGPIWSDGNALVSCVIRDISEQEELKQRNLYSEQRLAMALPVDGWGTFEWDLKTNALHWSAELERLYGLEPGQVNGSYDSWAELVLPEDRLSLRLAIDEAIVAGIFNADWRIRRKSDGQIRWLRSHARVHCDRASKAERMIGVKLDVTELKAAEEDQIASQRKLGLALAAGQMGTWDLDLGAGRIWRSHEYDRIFGYDAPLPEWTIATFLDHVSSDDRRSVEKELSRARETGFLDTECRITRADRASRWIALKGQVICDESHGLAHMIGVVHDVDDRKRADEKVHQVEARYQMLMDCVRDCAIYVLDPAGHIVTWNQSAQRLKGYTAEEILGEDFSIFYSPEDRAAGKPKADLQKAEREGETVIEDWRYRKNGSCFWGRVVITALRDENGALHGFSKVTRDLTVEKEADAALRRSNAELEQFAYVASHDLQEPLRMVASFTQLLAQRYKGKLDKDADEFIGFAVDGAKRMQHLIEDLLAYSRVGTQAKEPCLCEMNSIVADALKRLTVAIEENCARVEVSDLPRVYCDDAQMTSVFQNLIGNALKFHRPDAPPVIRVLATLEGSNCVLRVSDNGIGIDSRHFERIFQVFQRLQSREDYPGNGIGLAICKKIVERQGGKIWLESEPGQGTTFLISLPHADSHGDSGDARETERDVANPSFAS